MAVPAFASKRGQWKMTPPSSFDEQEILIQQQLEEKGKRNRKRSSIAFKNRRGPETKTSKRRGSEASRATVTERTMGSFFGIFSGANASEHTVETVDPASSDEEAKHRGKKMQNKTQSKKQNKKEKTKKEEKQKQTKKIPKLRLGRFNPFEKKKKKKTCDRSLTDKSDSEFGLSQRDIAEWVREQRTKSGEEKHPAEAMNMPMNMSMTPNIVTTESYDAMYEDQRDSVDSTMLSPLHATDECPEKDSALEKGAFQSLQYDRRESNRSIASSDSALEKEAFGSLHFDRRESNRSLASSDSLQRASNRSLASSDSMQREKSNRSLSEAHPIILAETNQSQMPSKTIHMPRQVSRQVSRKESLNRKSKTDLDITDHISLPEEAEKKPKSMRKKSKPKCSSSSSCGSTEQPINSRRKYPSKKGMRKPSSRKSGASASNRIDFAGGISKSPPKEQQVDTETVLSEMTSLRSLVGLMMTRMELYEMTLTDEQSDGLLQASLEYKKSKMAAEGDVASNSDKQKTKQKKKKLPSLDLQSSATTAQEENVDEMITKLEEERKLYQERLSFTEKQLQTLKDNQAETNMKILAELKQRLEEKNKQEGQPKECPPKDIAPQVPEKCPSLDSTSSDLSRSAFIPSKSSSLDSTKSSIDSISTSSNGSKSMFIPSKSAAMEMKDSLNRSRSKHIPKKNSSLDSKSSRSTTKSMDDEDASLCNSGIIDFSPEESEHTEHTIESTSSTKSVKFNPAVAVATTLSRYDMAPKEKFAYWAGDGDDEDLPDAIMKQLTEKWTVRKKIEDVEWELMSRQKGEKKILGDDTPLPSHLVSDCIRQRLPKTEREGYEGYTYTIGIQD